MAKTVDDKKIIYTMDRVSRTHGTKQVLKDISLSYFYGAKIGVIGSNGSGKSSLLRIMAGIDGDYTGEVSSAPGYTIGYLEQEPQLQSGKTVREVVSEGVQELVDLLAEFDKINEAFGDPDADMDKLLEFGQPPRPCYGSLAMSARRSGNRCAFRGRKKTGCPLQAPPSKARHSFIGRTYQPLGCRNGGMA